MLVVAFGFLRPSVLITVLRRFTKDPYPSTRMAALDGLILLGASIVVEDQCMVQGCYFRVVELLFDAEESVRCSAVCTISTWGQLIVALNQGKVKSDWSDTLFLQLCTMVRDMSMNVRVEAYDALAKIKLVSEDIMLQTLSKKASSSTKDKYYPGKCTAELFKLPASVDPFAFVHGLEDEFYEHDWREISIMSPAKDQGLCGFRKTFSDTHRSTSGYCVFLEDNLVSWSSKRQPTLSRSSAEAEYCGVANVVSESCWIRNLLLELHCPLRKATIVYCDNVSAVYLSGILFNTNAQSTLRWISISSVKRLPEAKYEFYMFHLVIRSPIFLPKGYLLFFLKIFVPVSAFVNLPFRLWGCDRICNNLVDYVIFIR